MSRLDRIDSETALASNAISASLVKQRSVQEQVDARRSKGTPAYPAAETIRPQLGSAPAIAV